jgi:hypothetical protein
MVLSILGVALAFGLLYFGVTREERRLAEVAKPRKR